MTKRYEIVFLNGLDKLCSIQDTEAKIPTFYNDLGYIDTIKPVCDLLNKQEETIQELKKENKFIKEEMRLLKVDLENIDLFEERKIKYSKFWVEKIKKLLSDVE